MGDSAANPPIDPQAGKPREKPREEARIDDLLDAHFVRRDDDVKIPPLPSPSDYAAAAPARDYVAEFSRGEVLPPFISKYLTEPWPLPVPGYSTFPPRAEHQQRFKQYRADSGAIYNPPQHARCEWMPKVDPHSCVRRQVRDARHERTVNEYKALAARDRLYDLDRARAALHETLDECDALIAQARAEREAEQEMPAPVLPPLEEQEGSGSAAVAAPEQPEMGSGPTPFPGDDAQRPRRMRMPCVRMPSARNTQANSGAQANSDAPAKPAREFGPEELMAEAEHIGRERDNLRRVRRVRAQAGIALKDTLALMQRAALCLMKLAPIREQAFLNLLQVSDTDDLRRAFLEDRAHAVVGGCLMALDERFSDVGFGGWMPFRFPDQWLQFTSLMRKILAANGLLTPKGPNHWREFLEKTQEPQCEEDEGPFGDIRPPKSWSLQRRNREIGTFEELIEEATSAARQNRRLRQFAEDFEKWRIARDKPP